MELSHYNMRQPANLKFGGHFMKSNLRRLMAVFAILILSLGMLTACDAKTNTNSTALEQETKKVLRIAMECSYAPYNWTQPDDRNGAVPIFDSSDYANGYDVMMAKHIADELGYELQIVKLDWDSLVPAVQSGTVDAVIAGQSITESRMKMVDFTTPYYYASIVALVKADGPYANATGVADLAGATATSQLNTVWYDACLPQVPNANILPAQESASAMLVSLNANKADLVVTDMPTAKAAIATYDNFKLLDFTESDDNFKVSQEEINIGISLKKGNTELRDSINGVLSKMTVEDYNKMMDDAISVQPSSMPSDFLGRIFYILKEYGASFMRGAGVTMLIALVGTIIGCIIGFAVGIIQAFPTSKRDPFMKRGLLWIVRLILNIYVEFFRGTPMMVQAMFIYFGSAAVFNINMSMWFAAFFIVSINTGAYMAETVRGGILSIEPGQTEGAKAIGMTHIQTMIYVIIPQALRNIMPQIGNNLIINIKDTCVLSIIGTVELFYVTKGIAGALYTYFEAFTIVMAIYFILTFTCSRILRHLEGKLDGPDNYDLATTDTLAHTSGLYKYTGKRKEEEH